LFFLEGLIVEGLVGICYLIRKRLQEEFYKWGIVEDTMKIGSQTFVINEISILTSIAEM